MDDWNYLAARVVGDGQIEVIETDLPLDIRAIDSNLSAPPTLSGTITNEVKRLKKDGRPIFEPWSTAIIAEADGIIRGAGIYRSPKFTGSEWTLDVAGFTCYPQTQTYTGGKYFVDTDPLDIFRYIWGWLQELPAGNLGITIDPLASPVRIGKELQTVQFNAETSPGKIEQVSFEEGPRKLNWYSTHDLGREIDDLAKESPFDWQETTRWDGDDVRVHVGLGYPQIGGRSEHTFVLGENLATDPTVSGGDYCNGVWVVGAGDGRKSVRGFAGISDDRLRRHITVVDKAVKSKAAANKRATSELAKRRGEFVIDKVTVFDHPNAPLRAIELGNEYLLYAETEWAVVDQYVRVVGKSESPGKSDEATLTIVRQAAA